MPRYAWVYMYMLTVYKLGKNNNKYTHTQNYQNQQNSYIWLYYNFMRFDGLFM